MSEKEETVIPPVEQYSFSKLSTWWQCKYSYFLKYIEHKAGIGNAFSEYGSFVHEIMEKYAKGEAELWDLSAIYEWGFDTSVVSKFPWNKYVSLKESYYKQGLEFLKSFQGYENYKILGVEQEFTLPIDDWYLTGFIDLLFTDENGKLIIRDYKSKASFKDDAEKYKYARQMYLYSIYVKNTYGKFPDELQFLMFRKQNLITIPFHVDDYHEAIDWAKNTVADIRASFDYPPVNTVCDDFYSQNLCNHREYCDFRQKKKTRKKS